MALNTTESHLPLFHLPIECASSLQNTAPLPKPRPSLHAGVDKPRPLNSVRWKHDKGIKVGYR